MKKVLMGIYVVISLFLVFIACGKKVNKHGEIGKVVNGSALDCKVKDKANPSCKEKPKVPSNDQNNDTGDTSIPGNSEEKKGPENLSGGVQPNEANKKWTTFPNIENQKISLHMMDNTAMIASMHISAENEKNFSDTQVLCQDTKATNVVTANPDEIKNVDAQIFIWNKSSFVVDMMVKQGPGKSDNPKPYLISCQSSADAELTRFEGIADYEVKRLDVGMSTFEIIGVGDSKDKGVSASIKCYNDNDILDEKPILTDNNWAINRIKLTKGSTITIRRAMGKVIGGKTLEKMQGEKGAKPNVVIHCQ